MARTTYSDSKSMNGEAPIASVAAINGHPLHPSLVPFPITFLIATLGSDLALTATEDPFWYRASLWLLGAGIVMAVVAAFFGVIEFASRRRIRALSKAWYHGIGNSIIVILAMINWWMRYSDVTGLNSGGATDTATATGGVSNWPTLLTGSELTLSVICAVGVFVTAWWGGHLVYNHMAGVTPEHHQPM